jgi:hypothetical protein
MENTAELSWRKSSFSGNGGPNCVEAADHDGEILVRDTKDHGHGPVHRFTPAEWHTFITTVRTLHPTRLQ